LIGIIQAQRGKWKYSRTIFFILRDPVQQQRRGVYLLIDPASPNWASVNFSARRNPLPAMGGNTLLDEITPCTVVIDRLMSRLLPPAREAGPSRRRPM
jgi:hypothetical protein